jgi:ankyrin repeat protein
VQFLLGQGADVNLADAGSGYTSLHHAADNQRFDIIDLLIMAGADVNAQTTEFKDTALHLAAHEHDHEMVEVLLAAGADKTLANADGETAYVSC